MTFENSKNIKLIFIKNEIPKTREKYPDNLN